MDTLGQGYTHTNTHTHGHTDKNVIQNLCTINIEVAKKTGDTSSDKCQLLHAWFRQKQCHDGNEPNGSAREM